MKAGLEKLADASTDVEKMKGELREQEKILKVEEEKTNKLLAKVQLEITFEIRKKIDLKSVR